MTIQPMSIASSIIDRFNDLKDLRSQDLPELELRRIFRDIEKIKEVNLYDYHMLMGMYYSLTKDIDQAIKHHEISLQGGLDYYYKNFAYMLRHVDLHAKALDAMIDAFRLDFGVEIADDVFSGMIHAVDTSRFDEVVDLFERAKPEVDIASLPHYRQVLLMRHFLNVVGLKESDYMAAKQLVDRVLAENGLTYHAFKQGVHGMAGEEYFFTKLISDYTAKEMVVVNSAIADSMVESGINGWDRMVFTLISQPDVIEKNRH